MILQVAAAIRSRIPLPEFHPGKLSVWLRFVRLAPGGEVPIGPAQKLITSARDEEEFFHTIAENVLLAVYGAEIPIVHEMPNLIIKLFDRKAPIQMDGAPPLEEPDQIHLKVTVYRYEPSLWQQIFGGRA